MPSNTLGSNFSLLSFGESHGKCIGAIVDGCPAGLQLSELDIQPFLDLRKPGQSVITTQRKEEDVVTILSGVFNGYTTGAPICMIIWNKDSDSRSYDVFRTKPRPGHADYTGIVKYGGFNDYRGSGRFSGRLTATIVMGGAIALKILKKYLNIEVISYTKSIGDISLDTREMPFQLLRENRYSNDVRCPDNRTAQKMKESILTARRDGDSLGGVIEGIIQNVPPGLGEPIFESLESEISRGLFSIPAVKGVEFGSGFFGSSIRGSINNDSFILDPQSNTIRTKSNNSGGILGGISDGMPITFRVAFKPAASIPKPQKTVDLGSMSEAELTVGGRHDPCVVPRAPPVIDSIAGIILLDNCLKCNLIPRVLH
ncbi:chorismate synthase [Candidatus Nitrosocosmicus sp. SS]|jgi:chorismate synthase|uniref:chorismate synthase n=1 Tax=Candidatus Nitrosocosmicus agrestis TaxID=2563600 RepID=UPI00122DD37B|nr:chorismate synthase [Candidatus Nitrosocosmicus sp. SS]KAF0867893.1 chorismate synthase [Candidatus Nitrosocosmicus sp. SS]